LEWSPQQLVFKVDGITHFTYNPSVKDGNTWPFDSEHYLLLNVAIEPSIDPNFTQDTMEVDYIRVYQDPATVSLPQYEGPFERLDAYPNPVENHLAIAVPIENNQAVPTQIYNTAGSLVLSPKAEINASELSLKGLDTLAQGVYFVRFSLQGKNYQVKFSKQ
jgi:hypothetical protein